MQDCDSIRSNATSQLVAEMEQQRSLGWDRTVEGLWSVTQHCITAFDNVNTCSRLITEDIYLLLRAELHKTIRQARATFAKFLMCTGNTRLQHKADQYKVGITAHQFCHHS